MIVAEIALLSVLSLAFIAWILDASPSWSDAPVRAPEVDDSPVPDATLDWIGLV